MSNSQWATNLKFLRERRGLTQVQLSETLGVGRNKLSSYESGAVLNPPVEELIRFSKFFQISIDTLLKVDIAKLSELRVRELEYGNDTYVQGQQVRILATTVNEHNEDNAEFVPIKAKAGYTTGYGDPEFIATLPHFSLPQLPRDRKYRMFPIEGDSMKPIPDGAYVAGEFVENWNAIKGRTPCVVITRNDGIVFKLVTPRSGGKNTLMLESINHAYSPYEVDASEVLEVWRFACYVSDTIPMGDVSLQNVAADIREMKRDLAWLAASANK